MKFTLRRVYLNSQGYTTEGYYYGVGERLYEYYYVDSEPMVSGTSGLIRAANREEAKQLIKHMHPSARFYN